MPQIVSIIAITIILIVVSVVVTLASGQRIQQGAAVCSTYSARDADF